MPTVNCQVCNRLQTIKTKDWKLILSDEPYVCSADCVEKWIRTPRKVELPWNDKMFRSFHAQTLLGEQDFKSNFEFRFRNWTWERALGFAEYEAVIFKVGNGFYSPDFYIGEHTCFIETKGRWGMGQKKKFRTFRASYPKVPILIVPWLIESEF